MVLRMESPAPPIKVDDWVQWRAPRQLSPRQGVPLRILGHWVRTVCGGDAPSDATAGKIQDSGFEVVGVSASEQGPTAEEPRTSLDACLTERFPNLNYRIAFDYTGEMKRLWMEPSSSLGIPTSFLVDRDGHIAFIGNPAELDDVLPKVLNGSWRKQR